MHIECYFCFNVLFLNHKWTELHYSFCMYVDPCLRGFSQTIPPVEEWNKYEVLQVDSDGDSSLYPELMFVCNGKLNRATIPYSITADPSREWEDMLSLELVIWRRKSVGWYSKYKELMRESVNIDSYTKDHKVLNNITNNLSQTFMEDIQKYDILQFNAREAAGSGRRRHIPYLLTDYQPPGHTKPVTVPLIHVDFSGQPKEGMV